jgi:hypothetical protein
VEAELGNLPDGSATHRSNNLKDRMAADIARFREMMADRRNASLARQVLRKLLVEPIKCVPITRDGKRDFAVRGRATTGAFTSASRLNIAANSWRPHGEPPQNPSSNSFAGSTCKAFGAAQGCLSNRAVSALIQHAAGPLGSSRALS